MTTNKSEWHNTGSNGQATHVWVRVVGRFTAEIRDLPKSRTATIYFDGEVDEDHAEVPFNNRCMSLDFVKAWCDIFMARQAAR